ncbi:MAG: hypothetical protein ABI254_05630 [Chthoniobacterales bacterium]
MKMHPLTLLGFCLMIVGTWVNLLSSHYQVIGLLGLFVGVAVTLIGSRLSKKRAAAAKRETEALSATRRKRMRRSILLLAVLAVLAIPFIWPLFGIIPVFARLSHHLKAIYYFVYMVTYVVAIGGIIIMLCVKLSRLPKDGDA